MAIITQQEENFFVPSPNPLFQEAEEKQVDSFQSAVKKPYCPKAIRVFKKSQLSDSIVRLFVQDKGTELKKLLITKSFFDSSTEKDWMELFNLAVILGKEEVFKALYPTRLDVLTTGESFTKSPVILAELLQAEKFQKVFDKKLNPEQKKERELTLDAFKITQLWKLKEKFETPKGSFSLYGAFSNYFLALIDLHAKPYFQNLGEQDPSKSAFYKEVYQGVTQMKNNLNTPPEELVKRLNQGEALSIQTGWKRHDINISFVKAHNKLYVAVSNRGESSSNGLEIYEAPDCRSPEKLKEVFSKLIRNSEEQCNQEFICKTLHKLLNTRLIYLSDHQLQKVGNCVWINNMGAVHALLQLIHIKNNPRFAKEVGRIEGACIPQETYKDFYFLRNCYKGLLRKIKNEEMDAFFNKYENNPWMANLVQELQEKERYRASKKTIDHSIKVLVPYKKTETWA